jgi:hypothetical protein
VHSTARALASRGSSFAVVAALVVVLAGCGAISSITGGASSSPGASGGSVPHRSVDPAASHAWPAAFADNLCAAGASLQAAMGDLAKLADAANGGDFAGVSKFAKAALTKMKAADAALKLAPVWKPSADAVATFRTALKTYITGLTDIEKGARTKNATLLLRSLPVLSNGLVQLAAVQKTGDALQQATGIDC